MLKATFAIGATTKKATEAARWTESWVGFAIGIALTVRVLAVRLPLPVRCAAGIARRSAQTRS